MRPGWGGFTTSRCEEWSGIAREEGGEDGAGDGCGGGVIMMRRARRSGPSGGGSP